MSDTYDNDMTEQCAEAVVTTSDVALPEQFKTVLGKMVKLAGRPFNDVLALITYSTSKMQGNVLLNCAIEDVEVLLENTENLYEEGFLENEFPGGSIFLYPPPPELLLPILGIFTYSSCLISLKAETGFDTIV